MGRRAVCRQCPTQLAVHRWHGQGRTTQCRELFQQVVVGGSGSCSFHKHSVGKATRLGSSQVGIQPGSRFTPCSRCGDPVLVLLTALLGVVQVRADGVVLVAQGLCKVAQLGHVLLGQGRIAAGQSTHDPVGVLSQRWVLASVSFTLTAECHLAGHSIHCISGITQHHGFGQSLGTLQADALHGCDLDLASFSHGQGVGHHIARQGVRSVLGPHHDFRRCIRVHRLQRWALAQALRNSLASLVNLLGSFDVGKRLEDARQVGSFRGTLRHRGHDGIHITTGCQILCTIQQVIHIGHRGDEALNGLRCVQLLGLLQHVTGDLAHCVRQVVGGLQSGTKGCRNLPRLVGHGELCRVIRKGSLQALQRGDLCCLGSLIQSRVLHDGLGSCWHQSLSSRCNGRGFLGCLVQVSAELHWRVALWSGCRCSSRSGSLVGHGIQHGIDCLARTQSCQAGSLNATSHQATKERTGTGLLTDTFTESLVLVGVATDSSVAGHLAGTTLHSFFDGFLTDVG